MSTTAETYAYLRENHRCAQCRKVDAYTLNGHVYCAECTEYRRRYYQKRRKDPERREKILRQANEFMADRRRQGLCPRCRRKSEPPYVYCAACRGKDRRRRRRLHPAWTDDGVSCTRCHKAPRLEGHKLCASCYAHMMEAQKLGAAASRSRKRKGAEA